MAERLNRCPKCGKYQYTDIVVKAHDPETLDMNMRATLRCGGTVLVMKDNPYWEGRMIESPHEVEGCGHEWEGLVASPIYHRLREQGQII